jgi:hypothetical protein
MLGGADAGGSVVELAGVAARDLHDVLQRFRRHRRMGEQQIMNDATSAIGARSLCGS